ncbi:MAG: prepilin-type N-terminal cleavage/methylation domain-containing protein [Candidatus Magnetomorum sp.]|nr:prepilin-type N-terminal cleavage/methylation domain-containing protein [Candidatus Magnetomorum sp.]
MISFIKKNFSGFTLLEVLVAIFLFAIVMTTIFGAYIQIFFTVQSTENDALTYEMGKNAMDRMLMDLNSIVITKPPIFKKPDARAEEDELDPYRFEGESDGEFGSLRFVSHAHIVIEGFSPKGGGVAQIKYYVTSDDQNAEIMVLRRCDDIDLEEGCDREDDPILCENVVGFNVSYVYYEQEENIETFTEWNSDDEDTKFSTPRAVEITLKLSDPDKPTEHPLVFQTGVTLPLYRLKDKKEM